MIYPSSIDFYEKKIDTCWAYISIDPREYRALLEEDPDKPLMSAAKEEQ